MARHSFIAASFALTLQTAGAAEGEASSRLVESPLSTASLANTAMGLLIVLAVMLALAWLVRRFMQAPGLGKGAVRVIGGVSLGARERAVLLSVGERRILVGIAPGQVRTLVDLGPTDPDSASSAAADTADFGTQLERLHDRQPTGHAGEVR